MNTLERPTRGQVGLPTPFHPWFGVRPNSMSHRALLLFGLIASLLFNLSILIDGAMRPGYDWLRQPMSALSLGPGGWVQVVGFIVFGATQIVTAAAWRASLVGGIGVTGIPIAKITSGATMIVAGIFSQDPGNGYPVGVAAPATPSLHAMIHQGVAIVSLSSAVAVLLVLAIRFRRESRWKRWAPWAIASAVLMMFSLALFGILTGQHGDGGIFEKIASWIPSLYGTLVVLRLLGTDLRVATDDSDVHAGRS